MQSIPYQAWFAPSLKTAPMFRLSPPNVFGPRPLVFLNGFQGVSCGVPFATALEKTKHAHGVIGLNLPKPAEIHSSSTDIPSSFSLMKFHANLVCDFLDANRLTWAHIVAHSYGSLLATYMTWAYPERVGSLVLLDSPITTIALQHNDSIVRDIQLARQNPNISPERIEAEKRKMMEVTPIPTADGEDLPYMKGDSPLVGYLTPSHIRYTKHPSLLIQPGQGSLLDKTLLATHRQCLNIRKVVAIKEATAHEDIFSDKYALQVAEAIQQWTDRYDPHALQLKRWQQIKDEGVKDFAEGSAGATTTQVTTDLSDMDNKKGRKGKREKKQ